VAELPSVEGCMIAVGEKIVTQGEWPEAMDVETVRDLEQRLASATVSASGKLPPVQTVTLFGEEQGISFFAAREVSVCVIHTARGFMPGVREKLAAAAEALSDGFAGPAVENSAPRE
jgi:hypothetical protein